LRIALYGTVGFLVAAALSLAVLAIIVIRLSDDLPSVHDLRTGYAPPQVTRILARDGTLLGSVYSERRTVVPVEKVPDHVKSAFLAAEDAHFYEHEGLNYLGLVRAMAANLRAGHVRQGGSTITQQVVKNVLLDHERSYKRKIRETLLAFRLERELSKDQILGMYMNHIYLGHGRYGVEEASRFLFGKHVAELDVAEGALLAGIVASPERYSPRKSEELALKRRRYVLGQMLAKGFMTPQLHDAVAGSPLRLAPAVETESDIAPELVEQGRRLLTQIVGESSRRGGYTVHTTVAPELQVAARKAVRSGLDQYLKRQKLAAPYTAEKRKLWSGLPEREPRRHGIYIARVVATDDQTGHIDVLVGSLQGRIKLRNEERYNPTHLPPSRFTAPGAALRVRLLDEPKSGTPEAPLRLRLELGPEAALIAIDVRTHEVVAAVGSYEAVAGGLDRSVQAKRQPGSTFKPLLYSYALHSRIITPATHFTFPVENHTDEIGSPTIESVSLRTGIARSDNRVAREVLSRVGAEQVVSWAHALGINSQLGATESLALGAYEVTPLEMATAFSVFASGGTLSEPIFIRRIESGSGEVPLPPRPPARAVIDPEVAYLTTHLLESVVQEGTGQRAKSLERPVAGKTGTTNKAKDAWFVGYSPEYVVAVWVGFDDALPLGNGESGASAALPIWIDFMKAAHAGTAVTEFPRPSGLIEVPIDPQTGLLARMGQSDAKTEVFLTGTEPTETAPEPSAAVEPGIDGGPEEPLPAPSRQRRRLEPSRRPTLWPPQCARLTGAMDLRRRSDPAGQIARAP
jgi:penicillin-binding protein 1A